MEFTWWHWVCYSLSSISMPMAFLYAYKWGKCNGQIEGLEKAKEIYTQVIKEMEDRE